MATGRHDLCSTELMITDLLLDNAALVPLGLLAAALLCVAVGLALLRPGRTRRRALVAAAGLAAIPVLALTLVPSLKASEGRLGCTVQFALPTLTTVELLANVALFVPVVFFSVLASRRPLFVLAAATGASAAVEAVQALVPALGRACDTNDWLMNTIGAGVAVLLGLATIALGQRGSMREREARG